MTDGPSERTNYLEQSSSQQDTSRPAKGKRGTKKGKGGREPTIVIVFFQIMTIVGESSQKLNKKGKNIFVKMWLLLSDFNK
jgi:hypothetical protein